MTCRASLAVAIGFPSSETATMPASFIPAISEIASPLLPTDAAPIGHTRTLPVALARSRMNRVTDALSFMGFVLGMQQTAVKPPRAAACVPVSIVSDDSCPGSRKWACRSINPGATIKPFASNISAPAPAPILPAAATSWIFSPSSKRSIAASVLLAGSMTRPFLISSIRGFLWFRFQRRVRPAFRRARNHQVENGHAHSHAIRYLFEHARLRAISDIRRNLDPAVNRARVQHNRIAVRTSQPLRIQLIQQNVVVRRKRRIVQPLGLHAQHKNDVRVLERLFHFVNAADGHARRDFLELARHPHCRSAQRELAPEFSQQMNVRTRHPAVQDVSENRHIEVFNRA